MILRSHIRQLIESVLLEGFKDDQRYLTEKYPEHADGLNRLQPKWIGWLTARFGESPKTEETHPFEDAIVTILNFSKKDAAIGEKYRTNEQFRTAVDARFPPTGRKWQTPSDPTAMTVDEMETIIGLSERKKQRFEVDDAEDVEGDRIGKIGPWNLWLPTTREKSCKIAGYDPVTREPKTTWCTARTAGSNLFYNYIGDGFEEVTLFYIIRDEPKDAKDWLSVGFVNGVPELAGEDGGLSVDRANKGLTPKRLRSILGPHRREIMQLLGQRNKELGGQHPAREKIRQAARSVEGLRYLTQGLSKDERGDLVMIVLEEPDVDSGVLVTLSGDPDIYIRSSVARNPSTPPDALMTLSGDSGDQVRRSVAENPKTPPGVLVTLSGDSESDVRSAVVRNPSTPADLIRAMSRDISGDVRIAVADNPKTPPSILVTLSGDSVDVVRLAVAENPKTPPSILVTLSGDSVDEVRAAVAENKFTPVPTLEKLLVDKHEYVRREAEKNLNARQQIQGEHLLRQFVRVML